MRGLSGRYRLEHRIGVGGMAVVWRAHDTVLDRPVAVKLLASGVPAGTPDERVSAEARAAARLTHPNVASVYDLGWYRLGLRRMPYLVMELVDAQTLAARLAHGPLDWRTGVRVCAEVAAGLSAAHAHGVVHRDVKPANVMLSPAGAKIVDFGIAAAVGQPGACDGGRLLGTPGYVAPERLRGEPAVPASDVYTLGVLAHHCLTGRLPWGADSPSEVTEAHLSGAPEPLPAGTGIPAEVADLVLRCLDKHPENRPTARYAALTLARAGGVRVHLPPRIPLRGAVEPEHTVEETAVVFDTAPTAGLPLLPDPRSVQRRLRRPAALAAAVTAVLLASAAAVPDRWLSSGAVGGAPMAAGSRGGAPAPGGRPAVTGDTTDCVVRYVLASDAPHRFTATVTIVVGAGDRTGDWTLGFTLPAGQDLVGVRGARWTQIGDEVTLQGATTSPASALTLTLERTGAGPAARPEAFMLDGARCRSARVRTTVVAAGEQAEARQRPRPRPTARPGHGSATSTRTPAPTASTTPTSLPAPTSPAPSTPTGSPPTSSAGPSRPGDPTGSPSSSSSPASASPTRSVAVPVEPTRVVMDGHPTRGDS